MTGSRRRSLRSRLALVYAGLVGVALTAVLAAVYFVARHDQVGRLDAEARIGAAALATETRHLKPTDLHPGSLAPRTALVSGPLLAVVDHGRVIAADATARRLATEMRRSGPTTASRTATVKVGKRDFRVASTPAGRERTAIAAIPFAEALEAREALLNAVLFVGGVGVALTALGAWLAARRALRPLVDIARTAVLVAPGDLGHRTGAEPLDEIGEVGAAVDRMLQRLEDAFAAQREFLQDASHELRTPLTIARGHLEVLAAEHDPDPDELHATVAIVLDELERMGRLIDGLLDLASASEAGELHSEPVEVAEALRRLLRDFRVVEPREWRFDAALDESITADRHALHGIVSNLLRNALAHSDDGSVIELSAWAVDGGVDISVRDYGRGVDPAIEHSLFDRFVHGSPGGFGLGLAIAQTLAHRQGGSVRHEAPSGGGARFVVHLPSGNGEMGRMGRD
jgi:two-component system, OmpR family, sensor kinase